jgi:ABC-2 type transport system ATP-binding protein
LPADPPIQVEDLTKVYPGGVRALGGVTFTVGSGEIFAYLGRNGAGKTTTVRILAGLTRKSGGRAVVGGVDLDRDPAAIRGVVGLAMQSASLDDLMTGREHLRLVASLYGMSRRDAGELADRQLQAFGLSQAADRLVATFSGGMRRRLDLALSLIHRPPILFLDEPTTGLDPQSRRAMWALIRELREQGATILLTTQYLEEADELADRVAVVDAGRIVALGAPDELKSAMGRTTVSFRLKDHAQASRLPRILAGGVPTITGDRVQVEVEGNGHQVTDLLTTLRNQDVAFDGLSVSEPSLEDVFVRLTGEEMDVSTASDTAVGVSAVGRFRSAGSRRQQG